MMRFLYKESKFRNAMRDSTSIPIPIANHKRFYIEKGLEYLCRLNYRKPESELNAHTSHSLILLNIPY